MPDPEVLARLEARHLVRREGARWRTTRRWRGALARASQRLEREGAPWADLRLPTASALLELDGSLDDDEVLRRVFALLELEGGELPAARRGT